MTRRDPHVLKRKQHPSISFREFRPHHAARYLDADTAGRLNQQLATLWVWTANSYRLRGFDLASCVRAANRAVRTSEAEHIALVRHTTRWRKRHQGRKKKKPTVPPPTAEAILLRKERRRAKELAKRRRKQKARRGTGGYRGDGGHGPSHID